MKIETEVISRSARETVDFARKLAMDAAAGAVITLNGDMGTGKTVFAQGFAQGLGISEMVNSPTFTILQIYEDGRLPLYHFDVYRIGDPQEMDEVGFDDYVYGEGVTLIEWAELIREILPARRLDITIEKEPAMGDDVRRITLRPAGGM